MAADLDPGMNRPQALRPLSVAGPFAAAIVRDVGSVQSQGPISAPILQQFFECSDRAAEISALAMVNLFAHRDPQALLWHDADRLSLPAFLSRTMGALEDLFPRLQAGAQALGGRSEGPVVMVEGDVDRGWSASRIVPRWRLAVDLGLPIADVETVMKTARGAYADFTPALPQPPTRGLMGAGTRLLASHDPRRRTSGYLLLSDQERSAILLHDVNPEDSRAVNTYLSAAVSRRPGLRQWRLAEYSLREGGDHFCRVVPCTPDESLLAVRSDATLALADVAGSLGVPAERLARLLVGAAGWRRWHSPFAGARLLAAVSRTTAPPRQRTARTVA